MPTYEYDQRRCERCDEGEEKEEEEEEEKAEDEEEDEEPREEEKLRRRIRKNSCRERRKEDLQGGWNVGGRAERERNCGLWKGRLSLLSSLSKHSMNCL